MNLFFAILATLVGLISTATMLTFMAAGSANASPKTLQIINLVMYGGGAFGLLCLSAAIWLMVLGRHQLATYCGIAPLPTFIVLFFILAYLEI